MKICVILVDRANYGRIRPVMLALQSDKYFQLQVVCAGTMLLERFGSAVKLVADDGFEISGKVFLEVEGSVPITMAKSVGLGVIEFSSELDRLKPDVVLLIGDRYEALAAAISAAYMNIPIAHIQGGEVSGSIDESARHAITKFSSLHFPSTARAAKYIYKLGEDPKSIFNVGCPAGDYILKLKDKLPKDFISNMGVGGAIDLEKPYLLVIFHPVTTIQENQGIVARELLHALDLIGMPTIWLWPNVDAGADEISKMLRVYRENSQSDWLHLIKNVSPVNFQMLLKDAACAIGNSSSFVRDSSFTGVPVVLVGERQHGRECGENVFISKSDFQSIVDGIKLQMQHGKYNGGGIYGDGSASKQIVDILKKYKFDKQKRLNYLDQE
jgi:UDP-hydrolysing UDP-N-acetyl-D-glucosamine 2-epimerase